MNFEAYKLEIEKSSRKEVCEKALEKAKALESENKRLLEDLEEQRKDTQIMRSQNNAKLDKTEKLVEKYKTIAKTAVDKYISAQATRIGVSSSDIKNRLTESYSFKDIDNAVEDLKQYKININSLPFTTMANKKSVKMQIRESKEPLLEMRDNSSYNVDDEIDTTLLNFTN